MIKFLLRQIILPLAVVFMSAGPASAAKPVPVWQGDTVKVAIPRDYPPSYYQNSVTGKASGFSIEVLNEIARLAGLKLTYIYGKPWQEIQEMVLDGRADIAPLAINEQRKKLFTFTPPIDNISVSLFALHSNTRVTGVVPGLVVGVLRSSIGYSYLKDRTDLKLITYDNIHKMLFDLLSGNIEAILFNDLTLLKLASDIGVDKKIHTIGKSVIEGKRCIAMRKTDQALQDRLSRATEAFVGSPEYLRIYGKWWGKPKSNWNTNVVVCLVGASALTVALIMAGWRYASIVRMKRKLDYAIESVESERTKTRIILDSMNDGISLFDRDLRLIYQNPVHIKMFGDGIDKKCQQVYDYPDGFQKCPVELAFHDGNPHALINIIKSDKETFLEICSAPLVGRAGVVSSVIVSVRDITEQKNYEELLQRQTLLLEQEIIEHNNAQKRLVVKKQQLEALNLMLEERVITEVEKNREQDRIMIHQGRLAAMGEMIGNIAHQWRQPLNNIGLLIQGLEIDFRDQALTAESMRLQVSKCMSLINYMSGTIDDFRNFYRPNKRKEPFVVSDAVDRVLSLVKATLNNQGIILNVIGNGAGSVDGYVNEYSQVLLNIINNSKDALLESSRKDPIITVCCDKLGEKSVVTIHDNAGGVSDIVIDKIFDPYFTTKEQAQGTGIGLYMAKMIIEKNMHGLLTVSNTDEGALFRIEV
ncbi:MAG TPA: transporter substrate-binding domain-containing protein [Desulfuromonadaceae bacterium]|jgi:signal transduction histidine kinase/ABC-type amino acid transport substrate-binding protein